VAAVALIPLAHAGHVIFDVILFLGPVMAMGIALLIVNVRAKREDSKGR